MISEVSVGSMSPEYPASSVDASTLVSFFFAWDSVRL